MANHLLRWSGERGFSGHVFGNREELRFIMQESGQGLSREERTMINRVLDLQNLTAGHIMIPMGKVVTVTAETSIGEVLKLAREQNVSRLPVWKQEGQRRRIVGLATLRTLLYSGQVDLNRSVGDYVNPALYLNDDTRLEVALRQMQRAGQRLAIVLGPHRLEVGVLSLQDILRVIFGEVSL
jgi:CBS domain containing-hemolysin-like protein